MLNSPGNQGHWMGLSVGATNFVGTRDGHTAVIRPAELTLRGQRLTGFVDRIGDPVPLLAPDGSKHRPEDLLADALATMTEAVTDGMPVADIAVTVPAHWRPSVVEILRRNLRGRLPIVSDATAALTALRATPGLPTRGVIALCDFGGSGTSITLVNAARDFSPFGETVRFGDFSGDQIGQAPRWSVHSPGCATSAAAPRSGCRPRRRPRCSRICPVTAPTSASLAPSSRTCWRLPSRNSLRRLTKRWIAMACPRQASRRWPASAAAPASR